MKRYLTKSRFSLALECETRLYYSGNKAYADQSADNPFLRELAKGGYQVGALARYYFYEDRPVPLVDTLDYEEALEQTRVMIESGEKYIAEAAVQFEDLFIRVDIFGIDRARKKITFYEVKAKSRDHEDEFIRLNKKGEKKGTCSLAPEWYPYLMDAAFQQYVISMAYPGYDVSACLMLVNKEAVATVDGLNQLFRIRQKGKQYEVFTLREISRADLGNEILIRVPLDDVIDFIRNNPVESAAFPGIGFEDYVNRLAGAHTTGEKIEAPLSRACKNCQFRTAPGDPGLKSGIRECWTSKLGISDREFEKPKVIDLWGGKAGPESVVQKLMDKGKYFQDELVMADLPGEPKEQDGLSPFERRWKQVEYARGRTGFYFDREGFRSEMRTWQYPLHFIDFETSSVALPFTSGSHPYEGIAFQYSHHIMDEPGKVVHKSQFLEAEPGVNPNLAFIRSLRKDLSTDRGTIFRYHNHENSYLRTLRNWLYGLSGEQAPDKAGLLAFIDSITRYDAGRQRISGVRDMVDMYELVLRYYYSPHAGGSNSLKKILPAAIHDSDFLATRYGRPIYGKDLEVPSLNFERHTWILPEFEHDPYKTLPPVFEGHDREDLDELFDDMAELADGGAAMTAYAKLQFTEMPPDQREAIRQALLKYCELDTMAMVMLMEFWMEEVKK